MIIFPPSMESAQAHHIDCSCQNTSEAPVNKGHWSTIPPFAWVRQGRRLACTIWRAQTSIQRILVIVHCYGISKEVVIIGNCIDDNQSINGVLSKIICSAGLGGGELALSSLLLVPTLLLVQPKTSGKFPTQGGKFPMRGGKIRLIWKL